MHGFSFVPTMYARVGTWLKNIWESHEPSGHGFWVWMASFNRNVVPDVVVNWLRALPATFRLGGGAVLSGVHFHHRLSKDVDLFFADRAELRSCARDLNQRVQDAGYTVVTVQDAPTFVRLHFPSLSYSADLVFESLPDLEPPLLVEGVSTQSLTDLRAAKVTCLLSRAEPRDLVDIYEAAKRGFSMLDDLENATKKDGGVDPATLAWLLRDFPLQPLPALLTALEPSELSQFRDALARDLLRLATAG
jgi:Nucleotidyl transferase AbiEii toxin, Type IV TA system